MINRLKKSIKHRLLTEVSDKNPLTYLKIYDVDEYLPVAISIIYLHTRVKKGTNKTIYIAETISAIGHGIRNFFKLKKDSSLAAKTGAFILYSFEEMGMIEVFLGQSSNGNNGYVVKILNDEAISTLWSKLEIKNIEKLPSEKPHEPWTKARNSKGAQLVNMLMRDIFYL